MVNSKCQTFPLNFIHNKDALLASNVETCRSGDDWNFWKNFNDWKCRKGCNPDSLSFWIIHIQHMMELPNPAIMVCSDVGPQSPAPIVLLLAVCVSVLEGVRIRVLTPAQCWPGSSRWSWSICRHRVWCQAVWACWWRRLWGMAGHSSEEASPQIWRLDWIDCTDWGETGSWCFNFITLLDRLSWYLLISSAEALVTGTNLWD